MITEFEAKGTPSERGRLLGERYREKIREDLSLVPDQPWNRERKEAFLGAMRAHLAEMFPDVLEEIEGIAQGAGIPPDFAFLKSTFNALGPAFQASGCSTVAFTASDVGPILGKTDDGHFRQAHDRLDSLAILTVRPSEGYDTLCINMVGTVWAECGINEKGLCVGANSGHPPMTGQDGRGVPQHIIPRLVLLRCATVKEAVDFLRATPLAGKGINIVLADAEGEAAATENTGTMNGVRVPENGVVFSTNHYFAPEMQAEMWKWAPEFISTRYFQNSVNRIAHLFGTYGGGREELTFDRMKETLMDEHNPGGLCQRLENNEADMATNFGVIMVSRKRELWLNQGPPSLDRFERFALA